MKEKMRISEATLKNYYESLNTFINEYLHSFRDKYHMRYIISYEVTNNILNNSMDHLKSIMDGTVELMKLEMDKYNEDTSNANPIPNHD